MWDNQPLTLYHGTDLLSAAAIKQDGIDLRLCNQGTDFGQGFYTTTRFRQAANWANDRVKNNTKFGRNRGAATVLVFQADRDKMAALETLVFVREGSDTDYWDFVEYCRKGGRPHNRRRERFRYSCVCGPVSFWPQLLTFSDADQFSFHDREATEVLGTPTISRIALNLSGLFPKRVILRSP